MNDKANIHDSGSVVNQHRIRGRGRRTFWVLVLIGVAVALAGYLPGCAGHHRHEGIFAKDVRQSIHERAEWALTQVDATDEQREKITAILKDLDSDLVRWQEERRALRSRFMQALQTEQMNPDDLATIKSAGITLTDEALSRTMDVALQVSGVLTPKQREELVTTWRASQ